VGEKRSFASVLVFHLVERIRYIVFGPLQSKVPDQDTIHPFVCSSKTTDSSVWKSCFEPYVLSPVVGTWENPNPKNLQPSLFFCLHVEREAEHS
jgi:hypothetical protein